MSRLARPIFLIPLIIAVALVAAGAWWWSMAGTSTPVSGEQAGREYGGGRNAPNAIPGGPRPGVWTYRATGDETVGAGPVKIDRDLPATAQMVVRPARRGFWRTLAFSEEHVEASRLRIAPEGEYLEERVTSLTVAGLGRDDREAVVPPPLAYPSALEPGQTWVERYSMDEVRVVVRAKAVRAMTVEVGGEAVPVILIEKKGVVTGPLAGFRDDRIWWSPALKMPVRWAISTDLDGFASLRMDADITLTSTEPST